MKNHLLIDYAYYLTHDLIFHELWGGYPEALEGIGGPVAVVTGRASQVHNRPLKGVLHGPLSCVNRHVMLKTKCILSALYSRQDGQHHCRKVSRASPLPGSQNVLRIELLMQQVALSDARIYVILFLGGIGQSSDAI